MTDRMTQLAAIAQRFGHVQIRYRQDWGAWFATCCTTNLEEIAALDSIESGTTVRSATPDGAIDALLAAVAGRDATNAASADAGNQVTRAAYEYAMRAACEAAGQHDPGCLARQAVRQVAIDAVYNGVGHPDHTNTEE